jgi:hypothetical protein
MDEFNLDIKEAILELLDGKIINSDDGCFIKFNKERGTFDYAVDGLDIKFDGESYRFESGRRYKIYEEPKPKKRYWLWDVIVGNVISKNAYYMDDEGMLTSGNPHYDKESLVRKHEDDWVEV